MSDIDYQAIADDLRAHNPAPRIDMEPGEFFAANAIYAFADALERLGAAA